MRRLGSVLMAIGAAVGVGTGLAVLTGVHIPGVESWLVAVAVAKLGFIAGFALIAAGAMFHRFAARSEHNYPNAISSESRSGQALSSGTPPIQPVPIPPRERSSS